MTQIQRWNEDKKHRCPDCHTIAVFPERPSSFNVYTCCNCGVRFARWPWLGRSLRNAGVRCGERTHGAVNADAADAYMAEVRTLMEDV